MLGVAVAIVILLYFIMSKYPKKSLMVPKKIEQNSPKKSTWEIRKLSSFPSRKEEEKGEGAQHETD
jgi:hypothetical protein